MFLYSDKFSNKLQGYKINLNFLECKLERALGVSLVISVPVISTKTSVVY